MIKLATEATDEEKKKGRKLHDIDVDEITICEAGANRQRFFIRKSNQEILDAVGAFLKDGAGGEEIAKQDVSTEEFIAAIEELALYKEDMPDSMRTAVDTLLRYVAQAGMLEAEEEEKEEEEDVKKIDQDPVDNFPSFKLPGEMAVEVVEKVEAEEELEEEEEEFDEMNFDPVQIKLKRLEKKLDALGEEEEPEDPWPSLNRLFSHTAIVKAQPEAKEDPNKKGAPVRKQITDKGDADEEGLEKIAKVDPNEDQWPSVMDPYILAGKG